MRLKRSERSPVIDSDYRLPAKERTRNVARLLQELADQALKSLETSMRYQVFGPLLEDRVPPSP